MSRQIYKDSHRARFRGHARNEYVAIELVAVAFLAVEWVSAIACTAAYGTPRTIKEATSCCPSDCRRCNQGSAQKPNPHFPLFHVITSSWLTNLFAVGTYVKAGQINRIGGLCFSLSLGLIYSDAPNSMISSHHERYSKLLIRHLNHVIFVTVRTICPLYFKG
jgi:hypothetical protein